LFSNINCVTTDYDFIITPFLENIQDTNKTHIIPVDVLADNSDKVTKNISIFNLDHVDPTHVFVQGGPGPETRSNCNR